MRRSKGGLIEPKQPQPPKAEDFDLDKLKAMSAYDLKRGGFHCYARKDKLWELWLYPDTWYFSIKPGTPVEILQSGFEIFQPGKTSGRTIGNNLVLGFYRELQE